MAVNFSLPQWNKTKVTQAIYQLLIGMLGASLLMLVFHFIEPSKRIVTVDVTGLINHFVKLESKKKTSSDQLKIQVQIFANTLEKTLHELSDKQHMIIFPKEAIISGAVDFSEIVAERINIKLGLDLLNEAEAVGDKT